jgi:hypothetical protein
MFSGEGCFIEGWMCIRAKLKGVDGLKEELEG